MSKREEITDVISDGAFEDPEFKKGLVLKFEKATLKITKIDRKNKRVWAEHIALYDFKSGMSHYGHLVDTTNPEGIYCTDCQVTIDQPSTEDGEKKALDRQDDEEAKNAEKSS